MDNLWPAWFYGPKNQAFIFDSRNEVPEGWVDHPTKVGLLPVEPVEPVGSKAGKKSKVPLDL